jgi:integrase
MLSNAIHSRVVPQWYPEPQGTVMQARFTDKFIKAAKARGGARTDYWDTNVKRLGLRVSPTGHKTWVLMYRREADGAKRRLKLGEYPIVSLAEARANALDMLSRVERGADPASSKQDAKRDPTVADLAKLYVDRYAKANRRSWKEDERRLNQNIIPAIGKHKANLVTATDLIELHDSITQRGAPVEANRNIELVRRVYSWAMGKRKVDRNPAERLELNPERSRDRVLSEDEIKAFWTGVDKLPMEPATKLVLRLALLTGQRLDEIAGASLKELDFKRAVWTIPGERTKNGLTHTVPLSSLALSLFRGAKKTPAPDGYLFPSAKDNGRLRRRSISRALLRNSDALKIKKFTPHDLRRTVASQMAALGIDRIVTGKVLNHASVDRDTVTGMIYDRHSYDVEKMRAMERWADRLVEIIEGRNKPSKIVRLRP